MPVNYAKKYLTFVQTVTVFLPLKFFFKMAAINPILKIKISNLKFISFFIYIFRKSLSNIGPRKVDPLYWVRMQYTFFSSLQAKCRTVLESNHFKIVEVQLLCMTDSHLKSLSDLPQTSSACAPIVLHMHKKFEVNQTKIKGSCQSYTKAPPQES